MTSRFPSSEEAVALGARLREARVRQRLTQAQLAKNAGVERSQISKIEAGKARTLNQHVQDLCKHLHVAAYDSDDSGDNASLQHRLSALIEQAPHLVPAVTAVLGALEAAILVEPKR